LKLDGIGLFVKVEKVVKRSSKVAQNCAGSKLEFPSVGMEDSRKAGISTDF